MPRVALRRSFCAGPAGEGGGELLAGGVVFHVGGIRFGVSEHFAGSVDDGGAGSGGLGFLRGDFGERVRAVGFDAVSEEQRFLREVALDLGAERGFPAPPIITSRMAAVAAMTIRKTASSLKKMRFFIL